MGKFEALSLHELAVERHFQRDTNGVIVEDGALRAAHRSMSEARALFEQAGSAWEHITGDESMGAGERVKHSRNAVSALATRAAARLDNAREKLAAEIENVVRASIRPAVSDSPARVAAGVQVRDVLRN